MLDTYTLYVLVVKSQSLSYWHKLFYTNFREALTTNLEAMAMAGLWAGANGAHCFCAATGTATAANSLFEH